MQSNATRRASVISFRVFVLRCTGGWKLAGLPESLFSIDGWNPVTIPALGFFCVQAAAKTAADFFAESQIQKKHNRE